MQFKILLHCTRKKLFLPFDYQYAMASAIYKLIARGDEAYSRFLHDEGFSANGLKRFKLFTFSPLVLPRYTAWKEKGLFELHGQTLSFTISFMADKAAEAFIKGMFADQHLIIGDRFNQLELEVTGIEAETPPFFTSTMQYRCLSPLLLSVMENHKQYETYLAPDHPVYEDVLIRNLISKCAAYNILNADEQSETTVKFELAGNYKSKLITIKPYTIQQTKVRGFMFDFTLTAPEYIHEMGYYAGFGINNSMGFGCVNFKYAN